MNIFTTPNYEKIQPDEFLMESIRLFHLRLAIDKAELLERVSSAGLPNCTTPERAAEIRKYYTMDCVFALDSFMNHKSLEIHIHPEIDTNGRVTFSRRMLLDGREIKEKYMSVELHNIQRSLKNHISNMGQRYHYNRKFKHWPNVYR